MPAVKAEGAVLSTLERQTVFTPMGAAHAGGKDKFSPGDAVPIVHGIEGNNCGDFFCQDPQLCFQAQRGRQSLGQAGERVLRGTPLLKGLLQGREADGM
ncbi:MAG: hypothetical protein AWU57_2880 [Marinobacter sp. T13-3]|nr:MAG: hypothetical protein AWU57_2880 [Marinobacter sp. T13-3]